MFSLSAKKIATLIDSPTPKSKDHHKILTRKPQTPSFTRKTKDQVLMTQQICITRGGSREKSRSHLDKLTTNKSLKQLNPPPCPEIKFLSPKSMKDSKFMSESMLSISQKSLRFSRSNLTNPKQLLNLSMMSRISEQQCQENVCPPQISQISLESFVKSETQETMAHSEDQSALERENTRLKHENMTLKRQNESYLKRINQLSEELSHQSPKKRTTTSIYQKCKNCVSLEDKIKVQIKYISLYESSIASKQKEIERLKHELYEARLENAKERQNYSNLKAEYRSISAKYSEGEKMKQELGNIIDSLNAKLDNHEQQMRYYGIQQSILLKKKQENEQWKSEAFKLTLQKQALKDLVRTYKQKLDLIRNINKQKRLTKTKSQKDIYYEDLFELSSEQSDGSL